MTPPPGEIDVVGQTCSPAPVSSFCIVGLPAKSPRIYRPHAAKSRTVISAGDHTDWVAVRQLSDEHTRRPSRALAGADVPSRVVPSWASEVGGSRGGSVLQSSQSIVNRCRIASKRTRSRFPHRPQFTSRQSLSASMVIVCRNRCAETASRSAAYRTTKPHRPQNVFRRAWCGRSPSSR